MGNAPANLSILRAFAINILRRNGHTSITIAQKFLSNDIDKIVFMAYCSPVQQLGRALC